MAYVDERIEAAAVPARAPILPAHYVLPFILVTTLFFSWALAAQLNDVLIRQFQKAFDLTRGQSGLIQTAFYGGYFLGALPAGLVMRKVGYKNGILVGLALYFIGALLFYPAAEMRLFPFLSRRALHHRVRPVVSRDRGQPFRVHDGASGNRPSAPESRAILLWRWRISRAVPRRLVHLLRHRTFGGRHCGDDADSAGCLSHG